MCYYYFINDYKMITLKNYISECGGTTAIPSNTIGMGNPMPPDENNIGSEPITVNKKKKKKVTESVFDDDLERKSEEFINLCKWLADHTISNKDYDDLLEKYIDNVTINADDSFDLPDSNAIGLPHYEFRITEALPNYVIFNNIESDTKFDIKCSGKFSLTGFPKTMLNNKKRTLINMFIKAEKVSELIIPDNILNQVNELEIIASNATDIYFMNKSTTLISLRVNFTKYLAKNSNVHIHYIPNNIYILQIPTKSLIYLLKESGAVSWSTNVDIF